MRSTDEGVIWSSEDQEAGDYERCQQARQASHEQREHLRVQVGPPLPQERGEESDRSIAVQRRIERAQRSRQRGSVPRRFDQTATGPSEFAVRGTLPENRAVG